MKPKLFAIIGAVVLAVTAVVVVAATHRAPASTNVTIAPSTPSHSAGPRPQGNGTAAGTVTVGPTTPVCRVGQACSGPGANLAVEVFYPNQQPVGATKTDSQGHYAFSLPAGKYIISVKNGYTTKTAAVTVASGQTATADFTLDTGIR